ncbi:MAG TPA: hypothetical protein VJU58_13700 [Microbacterium sp.]|nr:hypothetical protein [Microbacterium sp.]
MADLHILALARDVARRVHALAERDPVATRVLDRLLARLELGHDRYGALDLSSRDWKRERSDELLDAVVYDTAEQVRDNDLAHANLQAAAAEELRELERAQRDALRTSVIDLGRDREVKP